MASSHDQTTAAQPREVSRLASPLAVLLLVAAAALAVMAIALPLHQLTQDSAAATVTLDPAASATALGTVTAIPAQVSLTTVQPEGLQVGVVATSGVDGQPVPLHLKLLTDLGTSLWAAGLAVIAYLLARVLANISRGDPFHPSHARRFTLMAVAVLVCSAVADSVNYVAAVQFINYYRLPDAVDATADLSLVPVALAAVTLVLAGAFRAGRRIQDDTEGLV